MPFAVRKPDAAAANAELRRNLTLFGAAIVAVRAAPYIFALFQSKA